MINAIVKVLVVEFLILAVHFPDASVESDGHILVDEERRDLLVYRFRLSTCLSVERAEDNRAGGVIFHQGVIVRVDGMFGELGVEILSLALAEQLLQLGLLRHISELFLD